MESIDELYGIYTLYFTLEKAKKTLLKDPNRLKECALGLLNSPNDNLLNIGLKNLSPEEIKLNVSEDLVFDEKFMKSVEMHLLNLEKNDTLISINQIQINSSSNNQEIIRKRKKKFTAKTHKTSIIKHHLNSNSFLPIIEEIPSKISYQNIYKRKPLKQVLKK